jgi:hypothetical protein
MTTFSQLEDLADDESLPFAVRRIAEALASAIRDWPTYNLSSLSGFVVELKSEVADALTLKNVRATHDNYSMTTDGMCKRESLCGLFGAWDIGEEDITLDELVERIGLSI